MFGADGAAPSGASQLFQVHLKFPLPMSPILRPLLLFALFFSPLAHSADAPPPKLKYGTWGFDLSGADTSTKPGEDFFRYANGTWLDNTQIPPDKPAYSMRIIMTHFTE